MNQWNIFTWLFDNFDRALLDAVQVSANNLLAGVRPVLVLGITIWLAGTATVELVNPGTDPVSMLIRKCLRAVLVLGMITAASYTEIFETFVLTTLPNELTAAIAGGGTGGAGTPAAFDKLVNQGWVSVALILKNVSGWDPKTILIALIALVEYIVGVLFIAIGFVVFIASHIMLGLAVTIGPLFVCALLWEKSAFLFDAWIKTLLSQVTTQVLIVALLSVLLATEQNLLRQIIVMSASDGSLANDIGGQVHCMTESAILYFLIGYLAPKIVSLAESMTHGAAPGISGISQMAHGALGSAASRASKTAVAATKSGAAAIGRSGAIAMRSITPTGRAP